MGALRDDTPKRHPDNASGQDLCPSREKSDGVSISAVLSFSKVAAPLHLPMLQKGLSGALKLIQLPVPGLCEVGNLRLLPMTLFL